MDILPSQKKLEFATLNLLLIPLFLFVLPFHPGVVVVEILFVAILGVYLLDPRWQAKLSSLKNTGPLLFGILFLIILLDSVSLKTALKYKKLLIVPISFYTFSCFEHRKIIIKYILKTFLAISLFIFSLEIFNIHLNEHIFGSQIMVLNLIILFARLNLFSMLSILYITFLLFFYNDGRTGWVEFFALQPFVLFFITKKFNKNRALQIFLIFSSILATSGLAYKISHTTHIPGSEQSTSHRLNFALNSIEILKQDFKFFGSGTGSFPERYKNLENKNLKKVHTTNPHNFFLNLLIEQGIPGFLLFLSIIAYLFFSKSCDQYINTIKKLFAIMLFISCALNSSIMDLRIGMLLCFFTALILSYDQNNSQPYNHQQT